MRTTSHWLSGDSVLLRGVWRKKLWWAAPVTVVQDDSSLIALYWPAGTPSKGPENRLTPQQLLSSEQIVLVDRKWVDTDVLMLVTPGAAHAVYVMWEMGHTSLRCWYIDLQEPLRRTPIAFDTRDHLLDIVISADRSEWHWKDEDEFREAVAIGLFSRDEALSIRMEGERVVRMIQAGKSPFCDGWEEWSPPEEWGIPDFPTGWFNITTQDNSLR